MHAAKVITVMAYRQSSPDRCVGHFLDTLSNGMLSFKTDICSFGVLLWELVTGRLGFVKHDKQQPPEGASVLLRLCLAVQSLHDFRHSREELLVWHKRRQELGKT